MYFFIFFISIFILPGATDTIASRAKSPKRKCGPMDTVSLTRKRRYGTIVQKDRYGIILKISIGN